MMKRALLALLAVGLLAGGLAAPAGAEVTSTSPSQGSTYTFDTITTTPDTTNTDALASTTTGTTGLTVTLTRTSCVVFVCSTVYKFHMWKQWDWYVSAYGGVVINVQHRAWFTNVDSLEFPGTIHISDWYFYWNGVGPDSGHGTFAQAQVKNCIVVYGCISATYPWIQIEAHSDGSYHWSSGT